MDKVFQVLLVFLFLLFVISRFIKQQEQVFLAYRQITSIPVPETSGTFHLVIDALSHSLFLINEMNLWVIDLDKLSPPVLKFHGEKFHGLFLIPEKQLGIIYREEGASIQFDSTFNIPSENLQTEFDTPDFILYDSFILKYLVFPKMQAAMQCIDLEQKAPAQIFSLPGIPAFAVSDLQGSIFVTIPEKNMLVEIDFPAGGLVKRWYVAPGISPGRMAIDKKMHRLFILCENNLVVVFDYATGKPLTAIQPGNKPQSICYDEEDRILYILDVSGTLSIYRQGNGVKYLQLQSLSSTVGVNEMAFDPRTKRIFISSAELKYDGGRRNFAEILVLDNQG